MFDSLVFLKMVLLKVNYFEKYFFLLLLFMNVKLMSQSTVQGEYYFRKQEMVAGFNFSADGKFQFFYSYGAVDRMPQVLSWKIKTRSNLKVIRK